MYRFSREGREIAVISLFAAPFARVGDYMIHVKFISKSSLKIKSVKLSYSHSQGLKFTKM